MQTIHFGNLNMLYLLWILPVLIGLFIFAAYQRRQALNAFADKDILKRLNTSVDYAKRNGKLALIIIAYIMIVFALVRPGWNPKPRQLIRTGRDVVFVLDLSKSMLAEDLAPNRLERAKFAILDCLNVLQGDRVALVGFAGSAVVKCPLTLDYGFFRSMLEQLSVTSINRGGTLIGEAIRKVMDEVFDNKEKKYKDIILITDGEDHDSFPEDAAKAAGERGIRIIAIGLGDENSKQPIPVTDEQGQKTYLTYNNEVVSSKLDADTLKKMALATPGGKYIHVGTGYRDLGQDYRELVMSAEKRELESKTIEAFEEKFQIFLALAIILLVVELLLNEKRKGIAQPGKSPASGSTAGRPVTGPVSRGMANTLAGFLLCAGILQALLGAPDHLAALGMQDELVKGNNLYREGRYEEALKNYEKAALNDPESPYLYFNKGLAAFRMEDYSTAKENFEKAALKTNDVLVEAKVHYNLGNVAFKAAERQKDSDLEAAVKEYEQAVKHYQQALQLDPGLKDAGYNTEITRLILKDLMDKLQKQKEGNEEQRKKQEEIVKKLLALIERQTGHIEQNKDMLKTNRDNTTAAMGKKLNTLLSDQTTTRNDTMALSGEIAALAGNQAGQPGNQAAASTSAPANPASNNQMPLNTAKNHIDASVQEQGIALSFLEKKQPAEALPGQDKSLDELQQALAALTKQQQNNQQQSQQDQQPQNNQNNRQQGNKDKQESQAQEGQDKQQQQTDESKDPMARQDVRAEDILNQEKENNEKRQQYLNGGYAPVEKDW